MASVSQRKNYVRSDLVKYLEAVEKLYVEVNMMEEEKEKISAEVEKMKEERGGTWRMKQVS